MKGFAVLSVLVCYALAQRIDEENGSYIILAPSTIHPGLTYSLSVNIRKATGPVVVSATIKEEESKSAVANSEVTVSAGDVTTIDLEIPDTLSFPRSQYQLEVTGLGSDLNFTGTEYLQFDVTHFAIFIQTDKAIYKPGQTVNFRVFGVLPGMLPYTGPFDIVVTDPDSNIIQLWTDLQNETYGVISQSMLMSSEPVLGDWTIKATAEGQEKTKQVTIEEYVLPKFEVNVLLPSFLSGEDSHFNFQVEGKYTYGKAVDGEAEVEISFPYNDDHKMTRRLQVKGTGDVSVPLKELRNLYLSTYPWSDEFDDGSQIIVTAVITEGLTGLKQNATATLNYYIKPIKVEALPISSEIYKPGLTFTTFLSVTYQDGSMLTEKERREGLLVAFQQSIDYESEEWVRSSYSIPESGVVEVTYDVDQDATSLRIKGFYYRPSSQELDDYLPGVFDLYVTQMESPSDSYIQIAVETKQVNIGEDATLTVTTTEVPSELTYMVIAQGNIMLVDSLNDLTRAVNTITIRIDTMMAPKATVIVYFMNGDGEFVTDSVGLQVNGIFSNQVSVSFDRDTSEPGDEITFTVESSPESYVGILAVDQSVLILKSGNDVTRDEVIEGLSAISTKGEDDNDFGIVYRKKRTVYYPYYSASSSARQVLVNAGLIAFTDGTIPGYYFRRGDDYFDGVLFDAVPARAEAADANQKSAGSAGSSPVEVSVRKQFPETWLWSDIISDADGLVTVRTTVPDTITSWLGSAFAVSTTDGFGVSEAPVKTTVFKPFFVSLNLPYSIVRGETLILQATVFNYFDKEVTATVSLGKSADYEVINVDENGVEKASSEAVAEKITVPAGSGANVFFPLKISKLGLVNLEVRALSDRAGDAVRRQLLVEPEGLSHSVSESRLFNEQTDTEINEVFPIGLPPADELVDGSVRVVLSMTGDIMGPTMNNLDSLLKMPYGCGEQNMMNFAPDVFVYHYLTVTDQNSPEIKDKAYRFMLSGYQRELTYKHPDGSFSAFGTSDDSGSVWLTAFVAKSFTGAAQFITIDPNVIEKAASFIIGQQERAGTFHEPGRIVDRGIEGGVSPGATLTAYITIALQEVFNSPNISQSTKDDISGSISSARRYLEAQLRSIRSDPYALSLVTYALAITKSSSLDTFREALDSLAITEGGQRYWSAGDSSSTKEDFWYSPYHGPPSADVEMTAYAMLTYLEMDDLPGASAIAKWMTHQRNAFGGFGSTQDTVIGLQALTAFSLVFRETDPQIDLTISLSSNPSYAQDVTVNTDNAIILQQFELPTQSGDITVSGRGRGTCLMTLAIFYNLREVHQRRSFEYTISINDRDNNNLEIEACGRYLGEAEATSMCLMDIGIPSGFAADHDHLNDLIWNHQMVQKFETVQQSLYLYFTEIPKDELTCVTVHASRTNNVANVQPKYARLYDYYNPEEHVVVEYSSEVLQGSTICDVCPDCTGCSAGAKQPYVSFLLFAVTLMIAVLVSNV